MNMKEAYLVICASTGRRRCRAALCDGGDGGGVLTKRQTQNLLLAREDTTNLVLCSMYSAIRFGRNQVPRWEIFREQELRFGLDLG